MRLHRFYVSDSLELKHSFWLHEPQLLHQWIKVLRLAAGAEVILFDGTTHDRLYQIEKIDQNGAHMKHITDFERKEPKKQIYLFWSLLKKDKNDWVLQKCTELGVSHFVPVIAQRSEKTGFNMERAQKIVIEAAEQCGRSDIPNLREPMLVGTAIEDYNESMPLYVCEQSSAGINDNEGTLGLFVGPEGGWTDTEKKLFEDSGVLGYGLGDFTLRAETASVAAVAKLI